jgi:hypothetical protein
MNPPEYGSWPNPHQGAPHLPHTPWPTSGPYQILEGGPPPHRRPPWAWLVAVLAVIFLGAAAAGVILKLMHKVPGHVTARPPASQAAPADPRNEAEAVNALLNASSASRTQLGPALNSVETCGDLDAASSTLQQIVAQRQDQVNQGKGLAVDQLDNGSQLQDALVQALTYSLDADRHFAAWLANTKTTGCTGHAAHDGEWAAAQSASASATNSKVSFVSFWNPLASRYGLPTRTDSGF